MIAVVEGQWENAVKKPEKYIKYREGDWFGVPLKTGGWGIGIIVRKGRGHSILAYFFGPPRRELPQDTQVLDHLHHSQAVYRARPGIVGLRMGTWPILGRHENGSRDLFPNPWFGWVDAGGTHAMRERYNDDVSDSIREPCSIEEAFELPEECIPGNEAVEWILAEILAGRHREYGDPRPGTLPWTDKFPPPIRRIRGD